MIKKLLNNKISTITMAAVVLGAASFLSRLIGLFRDRILLNMFGTGRELDIYYAAFRIPDFVYAFFILGVISAGFVPVFIHYLQKDKEKSWYLANNILNLIAIVLIVVCLVLVFFVPYIVHLVAPGFEKESADMTIKLARIMFLSPIFLGISAVFSGILQSFRRFLIYSLAPIMYNLGIIFGALFLVKYFGLIGLAYGVVLGAFCHMMIQIPTAIFCGYKWRPILNLKFDGLKRVLKLMPPRFLSLIFYQITFWVFTAIASLLAVGSIVIYNTAYNIFSFPLGIFALSYAVAAFPKLSESAQKKDKREYVRTFSATARQILFFIIPVAVLFIILRLQIIQVLFSGGKFSWQDTMLIGQTLMYFCIGLFAEGLALFLLRGFFAWEDTITPFVLAFITMVIRIASGWYLTRFFGVAGLSLGFAIGSICFFVLLLICLRKKVGLLDGKNIFNSAIRIAIATLFAGGVSYFILNLLTIKIPAIVPIMMLLKGGIAGILGVIIYFVFAWILKIPEFYLFVSSLSRKLSIKKLPPRQEI
ncbi:MAG: murein biosynthesis integral membrane protein MurJ [bacterium]